MVVGQNVSVTDLHNVKNKTMADLSLKVRE